MSDGDLEAIRREHRQRLFDRYQSEAAAFSRVFTALLIFSVLFLAFALVPYAVLQQNRHVLARKIAAAESELAGRVEEVKKLESLREQLSAQVTERDQRVAALADQVKSTDQKTSAAAARIARNQEQAAKNAADQKQTKAALEALGQSQALIGAVRSDPAATVRELRTSFTAVVQDPRALQPDAACPANPDRTRLIGCRLAQRVTLWITERLQPLETQVIPVLVTIDETGATELRQKIAAVKKLPQERPTFWQSLDEKTIFSQELEHEIGTIVRELSQLADRAVAKVRDRREQLEREFRRLQEESAALQKDIDTARADQARLVSQRERLAAELAQTRAAQEKAEQKRAQLGERIDQIAEEKKQLAAAQARSIGQQDEIAKRLSSIQSPFGALPIGLREGILTFPMVVAVAYLLSAGSLASAIRLRATCHRLYREWDQQGRVVTDAQVALFAPLWVDPALAWSSQLMSICLLLAPIPMFLGAVGLIGYISTMPEAPPLHGTMGWTLYGLASVVALGMMLAGLRRMRRAWQTYRELARVAPDPLSSR